MLVSERRPRGGPRPDAARTAGRPAAGHVTAAFGPGPVVVGPGRPPTSAAAHASAREALSGLRAAPGWPDAPRPVAADDLLPERALAGDPARAPPAGRAAVGARCAAAGGELLRTLAAYLEGGGALEACARTLFVHPNTVRYRLRRVGELTGRSPDRPARRAGPAGRAGGGQDGRPHRPARTRPT